MGFSTLNKWVEQSRHDDLASRPYEDQAKEISRLRRADGHDAVMVAQIHDELILEADARSAEAVAALLAKEMTTAFAVTFPDAPTTDLVDVKAGSTWADLK
jgi:DNA polymerase I-like protein with 3'-5' exonuclease and polymerase domains